jgi:RNA polymerase sigma factor (sigma-70 family)
VARQFGEGFGLEDALQEINLKLITAGGSILSALPSEPPAAAAYFSVVAANAARDYYRARCNLSRRSPSTVSLNDCLDWLAIDSRALRRLERDLLMDQIEDSVSCEPRQRTVFRLYYRQGFKAREIASIPALNLTTKGVESMLHHIADDVRQKLDVTVSEPKEKSRRGPSD